MFLLPGSAFMAAIIFIQSVYVAGTCGGFGKAKEVYLYSTF